MNSFCVRWALCYCSACWVKIKASITKSAERRINCHCCGVNYQLFAVIHYTYVVQWVTSSCIRPQSATNNREFFRDGEDPIDQLLPPFFTGQYPLSVTCTLQMLAIHLCAVCRKSNSCTSRTRGNHLDYEATQGLCMNCKCRTFTL